MFRKLFTILILGAMFFSVMPTEAFCHDQQTTQQASQEHHHGVVVCHHVCCATIVEAELITNYNTETSSQYFAAFLFSYENPSLSRSNRPPIYSA